MSIDNLEHKQKIVYVGLRRMSDDRNLIIDGFKHWTESLSDGPLDVESTVAGLVDYLGLGSNEKKSLMIAMHAASNKMPEELPSVPKGLLDRIGGGNPSTESKGAFEVEDSNKIEKSLPPHCLVTSGYLQNLTRLLYKQFSEEFSDLKNILSTEEIEDISHLVQGAVKLWADEGLATLILPETATEAECKALCHGIYLFFTELIGPMDSDQLVNQAVQQTTNMEEVARFHPRLLV